MDIAAGLASLDAAIKIATGLRQLEKAYDQVALKGQVVDLMGSLYDVKGQLIEASQALAERDAEIARLSEAFLARDALLDGPGGYRWLDKGDGIKRGYPICPSCCLKGTYVQMVASGSFVNAICPSCDKKQSPVENFMEPGDDGSQQTMREKRAMDEQARHDEDTQMIRGRRV